MKQTLFWGLIIAVIVFSQIFDDSGSQQSSAGYEAANKPPKAEEKKEKQTYATKGVDNSWPAIPDGNLAQSENLLAKNYYVVLDGSGSMKDSGSTCTNGRKKMTVAKEAVSEFLNLVPTTDNVGLFVFDSYGQSERLALGSYSQSDRDREISRVREGGGTPLSLGITLGLQALTAQAQKQLGYGEYNIIVVTDGQHSAGYNPDAIVSELIEETPIVIHTIGFCLSNNHTLNRKGHTIYKAANNPAALREGLQEVLAESKDFDVLTFEG